MKACWLACVCTACAMAAELPIRTVILYKHGVGYFQRAGELAAGESARLDFKAADMNDVLKSLTIRDSSGAKVTGVRYDASEPLDKRLADYPFRLSARQPLSHFLDQLKGARIQVRAGAQTVSGTIVSAREVWDAEKKLEHELLTLMLDSGELRTLELGSIAGIKLDDEALERRLKEYLAALAAARSQDKRSVYIDSADVGSRRITASYMIPAAVWKSSYRLMFDDKEATLEGWAIVDNTSGEDWTKVNLSLVSGRPISFISKLYEPRYRSRPEAELAEERPVGPVVHPGAIVTAAEEAAPERRVAKALAPASPAPFAAADAGSRAKAESSIQVATTSGDLGELFEYRFATPVTIRSSESAMLPFLQEKVTARKLLIYADQSLQQPMNAAEITNTTGKTLDGGPITVFEGGVYAGEALVETLKAGDRRLISYGVDLGTRITTALDVARDQVREIHASRGILMTKMAVQETQTYTIRNVDAKPKTLIIEHPVRPQYKLLNQKPAETTASAYRFEVKLAAQASEKFPVIEERVWEQTITLVNLTLDQIGVYLANKTLSPEGRKQLEAVAAAKRQIAQTDSQLRALERQIDELVRDQERIRQNISSLNRVSGQQDQVQKYAAELAAQETRLAQMRDQLSLLRRQKSEQEQTLNALIEKMAF